MKLCRKCQVNPRSEIVTDTDGNPIVLCDECHGDYLVWMSDMDYANEVSIIQPEVEVYEEPVDLNDYEYQQRLALSLCPD